jgi:guanylate kinase
MEPTTLNVDDYVTRRGLMMVLSSPSGAGKTTLARRLLEKNSNMQLSVSHTTRSARPYEVEGRDYYFCTVEAFESLKEQGEFFETAKVFGNFYGTSKSPVKRALETGQDVLFDIDWQGTQQLAQHMGERVVSIFILPPSMIELQNRLHKRSSDSEDTIATRMSEAASEISHWAEYDYVIVNYSLDESLDNIEAILRAERLKRSRQIGLANFINALVEQKSS